MTPKCCAIQFPLSNPATRSCIVIFELLGSPSIARPALFSGRLGYTGQKRFRERVNIREQRLLRAAEPEDLPTDLLKAAEIRSSAP